MAIDLKDIMKNAQDFATDFINEKAVNKEYKSADPLSRDQIIRDYIEAFVADALIQYHEQLKKLLAEKGINI